MMARSKRLSECVIVETTTEPGSIYIKQFEYSFANQELLPRLGYTGM